MKKVYISKTECPRRKGRPVVRWKNRVKEYKAKGLNKQGGSVWIE